MLRICFKQQAEGGYSRLEGRPSRVLEFEIALRNLRKVLNLPPKKKLLAIGIILPPSIA